MVDRLVAKRVVRWAAATVSDLVGSLVVVTDFEMVVWLADHLVVMKVASKVVLREKTV